MSTPDNTEREYPLSLSDENSMLRVAEFSALTTSMTPEQRRTAAAKLRLIMGPHLRDFQNKSLSRTAEMLEDAQAIGATVLNKPFELDEVRRLVSEPGTEVT
jgi:hypothetical protein